MSKSAAENQIRFTNEFKDGFFIAMLNGTTAEEYFFQKGYDPAVIGFRRIGMRNPKKDQGLGIQAQGFKKNLLCQNWKAVRGLILERPGSRFPIIHEIFSDEAG